MADLGDEEKEGAAAEAEDIDTVGINSAPSSSKQHELDDDEPPAPVETKRNISIDNAGTRSGVRLGRLLLITKTNYY